MWKYLSIKVAVSYLAETPMHGSSGRNNSTVKVYYYYLNN